MANKWPDFEAVVILDGNGAQVTSFGGAGGTSMTDDAAFTAASSSFNPVGGIYQATPDSVNDGDGGAFRMSIDRILMVGGDVAHDSADSGNPVKIGGKQTSATAATAATAGDRVDAGYDVYSRALVATVGTNGTAGADGVTTVAVPLMAGVQDVSDSRPLVVALNGYNGTSWDRLRSDTTNGLVTGGGVAHDAADTGNPNKVGFKAISPDGTAPPVVAENDRSNLNGDLNGRAYVNTVHPENWSYHDDDAAAVTTDGTLHADPGDGFAVFITDIVFSIGAATASSLFIEEGSTKILGPYYLPATAGAGMAIHFTTPKRCTASTAILITNTGSITFAIDVMGYVAAV